MDQRAHSNSASKSVGISILLVFFVAFFFVGTTQYIAYKFSFSPALGEPLVGRLYSPHKAIIWTYGLSTQYLSAILIGWLVGVFVAVATTGALLLFLFLSKTRKKYMTGHGSARWADYEDIKQANLIDSRTNETSLIVGGFEKNKNADLSYLVQTGPESVLMYAPSRSGKGVSIVIPNLLSYEESVFVLDVKGELWEATAGYRRGSLGQKVLFHNPASNVEGNAKFNILEEIRIDKDEAVKDTQLICEYLIPSDSSSSKDQSSENDHFVTGARSLLVGVILYELVQNPTMVISVTHILSKVTSADNEPRKYFENMKDYRNSKCSYCNVINEIAAEQTHREDREFSSILSSMTNPLSIYRDPILARATASSDFKLIDLVEHESRVSLYMVIPPSDGGRLKNYFAMLLNVLCRRLTERLPDKNYKRHKLLLMLDEFSKLPPLPIIQESLDHFAGYGIKSLIVVQDVQTIYRLYGPNETIQSNCKVRIAFTPGKMETAEMMSKMIGNKTVEEKTQNRSRKAMSIVGDSISEAEGLHSRALVSVDEIMQLDVPIVDENERMIKAGGTILFVTGCRPIKGVQMPYFFDSEMHRRSKYIAPEYSDELHPSKEKVARPSPEEQLAEAIG